VVKTSVYLPTELTQGLRALARRTGRRQAELIREAIAGYVKAQERLWPRSIALGTSDGTVTSETIEAWIQEQWDRPIGSARKGRRAQ
jgi:predicted DNA-binding protein